MARRRKNDTISLAWLALLVVVFGFLIKLAVELLGLMIALLRRLWAAFTTSKQQSRPPARRALTEAEPAAPSPAKATADTDTWEGSFWDVGTPHAVHALLRFTYRNGDGQVSQRTVNIRRFGSYQNTTLVLGRCHLRNATRSFRTDRMRNCVDQETGEIITDVASWLHTRYASSPDRARDKLLADEHDLLSVLLYAAKIDGRVMAKERAAILQACNTLAPASQLTDKSLSNMLQAMDVPSIVAFRQALGRLARRDDATRALLVTTCENILRSKKTPTAEEQETLAYVQQHLTAQQI